MGCTCVTATVASAQTLAETTELFSTFKYFTDDGIHNFITSTMVADIDSHYKVHREKLQTQPRMVRYTITATLLKPNKQLTTIKNSKKNATHDNPIKNVNESTLTLPVCSIKLYNLSVDGEYISYYIHEIQMLSYLTQTRSNYRYLNLGSKHIPQLLNHCLEKTKRNSTKTYWGYIATQRRMEDDLVDIINAHQIVSFKVIAHVLRQMLYAIKY